MDNQNNNEIWSVPEELSNDPKFVKKSTEEFVSLPLVDQIAKQDDKDSAVKANRRDFLKYMGFGLGAATIAASCEIPVKRALPYVVKPDSIVPGVASYYASSFFDGSDYCSVLVKTREGRPIKIEGNVLSPISKGGTSARAQASVLSLYDTSRLQGPKIKVDGDLTDKSWEEVDKTILDHLKINSRIAIVSNTIISPSSKSAIAEFTSKYPNSKWVSYDPISSSAILQANQRSFGIGKIPSYHFDKAATIVSFGADFLGTWISPVEYSSDYAKNRIIDDSKAPSMSYHVQVESHMSLTGSNADNRVLIKPSEQGAAIAQLYAALGGSVKAPKINAKATDAIRKIAGKLKSSQGNSLVVSNSNNLGEQLMVNAINQLLGNYGNTISWGNASMQRQGLDLDIQGLVKDIASGRYDTVIFWNEVNPAFDLPNSSALIDALANVKMKISLAPKLNETATLCDICAPNHHYLESWSDSQPKEGSYSLIQPTIRPLFNTRQSSHSLLVWAQSDKLNVKSDQPYYEYVRSVWRNGLFSNQIGFASFQSFWDHVLHDGVYHIGTIRDTSLIEYNGDMGEYLSKINKPSNSELELSFFETVNVGNGIHLDNPWLTEMPDPITRTVWGNYLGIPVSWDGGNEINSMNGLNPDEVYGYADRVNITVNGIGSDNPVTCVRQFGLNAGTVALALGYGRKVIGEAGQEVGQNVYPMLKLDENGNTIFYSTDVIVSVKVDTDKLFPTVQYHHTMGVKKEDPNTGEEINVDEKTVMTLGSGYQGGLTDRTIIFQGNLKDRADLVDHIKEKRSEAKHLNDETLYPFEEYSEQFYSQGHHWGMHIDLNACTGCAACQVACIAENNVPVVGRIEVARHHEMAWLRIDRYYYGDFENPNVVYQPMMCQHCDNAPCENVCPVGATNHSSEGLNQMTYNRCIGTRYCANNCPYKVRRFNWLDYTTADLFPGNQESLNGEEGVPYGADNLTRMVLNPDVTVRSRGVIEKCSFCVQRIQEGKLTAKKERRSLRDGEVKSACQTACPTGAITFGDMNDKNSAVSKKIKSELNYRVLEEINTQTSVYYSAKVVNRDEAIS